jgi:hypothetical protein
MSAPTELQSSAPDLVEPVVGFRQWRLAGRTLNSLFSDEQWPHAELRARCKVGGHDPASAPSKACSCGIYAYYDPCPRRASAATPDFIGGVVVLWGRVELHATGMRAEHARIVALELPLSRGRKRRDLVEVADRLGVAAVPHRELKAVGAEHGSPLQRSLRPPRSWATAGSSQQIGVVPPAAPRSSATAGSRPPIGVVPRTAPHSSAFAATSQRSRP